MNNIFCTVWSKSRGQSVVTSELARRHTKSRDGGGRRAMLALGLVAGVGTLSPAQAYEAGGGTDCNSTNQDSRIAIGGSLNQSGAGAEACSDNAIAIGSDAAAGTTGTDNTALRSIAIGVSSNVTAASSVALGGNARAFADGVVSMGSNAIVNEGASSSIAIGRGSKVGNDSADSVGGVAMGFRAEANNLNTIAIGAAGGDGTTELDTGAAANAAHSIAIGANDVGAATTEAGASNSIALGGNATAGGVDAISLGRGTEATGNQSISLGSDAIASGVNAISIGTGNQVNGEGSGAIGDPTTINGDYSYSLGNDNTIYADSAGTFGNENVIGDENDATVAAGTRIIGNNNGTETDPVTADDAFIVGNNSNVSVNGGVALGSGSVADGGSLGDAPYQPEDADGAAIALEGTATPQSVVSVGDTDSERRITNVAPGSAGTDAVNVSQLSAVDSKADYASQGFDLSAESTNATNVAPGDTVDLNTSDDNLSITKNTTDGTAEAVTFDLADDLDVTSVTTGNSTLDNSGLSVGDGNGNTTTVTNDGLSVANGPSVTQSGIDAGDTTISNVADGENPNDAVNLSQLHDVSGGSGFDLSVQDGTASNVAPNGEVNLRSANDNLSVTQETANGREEVTFDLADNLNVGGPGAEGTPGEDGYIGVDGADGENGVAIDGSDGSIGLTGPAGADGTDGLTKITIQNGEPGVDGADGETTSRIVYTDPDGNEQEVANLEDGMKFAGNTGDPIAKQLNETLTVSGGLADTDDATGANLRVDSEEGQLNLVMAQNLTDLTSVTTGNSTLDDSGLTIDDGSGNTTTTVTNDGLSVADGPSVTASGGIDAGGDPISNVGAGQDDTDAVNVSQLNDATNADNGGGFGLADASDAEVNQDLGETIKVHDPDGDITTTADSANGELQLSLSNDLSVGGPGAEGAPGEDGYIGVDGADGENGVAIDGSDGSIGLTGPAGADGTDGLTKITVQNGEPGVDGADGETTSRIVYTDPDGNEQEVANLEDGMKFAGNTGDPIAKQLNETLTVSGGLADTDDATGANLRVDSEEGQLNLVMAQNLTDLNSVTTGNSTLNDSGLTIDDGSGNTTTVTNDGLSVADGPSVTASGGIDAGGDPISNVDAGQDDTDAVNVSQLSEVSDVANQGFNVQANGDTATQVSPGETVQFLDGDNIAITRDGANLTVATSADLTADSLTVNEGPTINGDGIDAGDTTISNVADGENPNDAVNVSQLEDLSLSGDGTNYYSVKDDGTQQDNYANDGAEGANSLAAGVAASTGVDADRALALGYNTSATGVDSMAMGQSASATAEGAVAIGHEATAEGGKSISIGYGNTASGDGAVSIGDPSTATGDGSVVVGKDNDANGTGSVALGNNNNSEGNGALAIGDNNISTGAGSITMGVSNEATGDGAVAMGNNNTVSGAGAFAVGNDATSNQDDTLALGTGAMASAQHAMALGNNSEASGLGSFAAGNTAVASGEKAMAVGQAATASALRSSAIGLEAQASEEDALAVGTQAEASGLRGSAIGNFSSAAGQGASAVGDRANAQAFGSLAIGARSTALHDQSIALGGASQTVRGAQNDYEAYGLDALQDSKGELAIGQVAVLDEDGNQLTEPGERQITGVAPGSEDTDAVNVSQLKAVADAESANRSHYYSVNSTETGEGSNYANDGATGTDAIAIGAGAEASNRASVALGSNSETAPVPPDGMTEMTVNGTQYAVAGTDPVGTVSAGNETQTRTMTNVAAGQVSDTSTDAINGSQLYATNEAINAIGDQVSNLGDDVSQPSDQAVKYDTNPDGSTNHDSITLEGGEGTTITNVADGDIAQNSSDAVNGGQLWDMQERIDNVQAGETKYFNANSEGEDSRAEGAESVAMGPESVAEGDHSVAAGDGAVAESDGGVALGAGSQATREGMNGAEEKFSGETVASNQGAVSVGSEGGERQVTNVAGGTQDTDAVNVRQLDAVQAGSVNYDRNDDGSVNYTSVTMGKEGSPTQVHNVAAGEADTDAANVGQLRQLDQRYRKQLGGLYRKIDDVEDQANAGTASAIAAASVPQATMSGKSMISAGAGTYSGESAVSVGVSRLSDNGRWAVKFNATGDSQSNFGAGVGMGFHW